MENYSALSHPYIFIDKQYAGMRNQKDYSPKALLGDCNNFIFFQNDFNAVTDFTKQKL